MLEFSPLSLGELMARRNAAARVLARMVIGTGALPNTNDYRVMLSDSFARLDMACER